MNSKIEIILIGSIDRLLESLNADSSYDSINIYHSYDDDDELMIIAHHFTELMNFMRSDEMFIGREYVLKKLNREDENRYLTLFAITDKENLSSIIYEELKNLPTTKYPRKE